MMISYNVPRANLAQAVKVTPGKKAPTISALEGADDVAVNALVHKKGSSAIMDALEEVGASDILLFNIANSRM